MRRALAAAALAVLALTPLPGRAADPGWNPLVAPGTPKPGPAVLYAPLATAPQFENAGVWQAPPLKVSGADAYVAGEYLFQDFVYDGYGANTSDVPFATPDPVPNAGDVAFGGMTGDMVYPTDAATYVHDAADLLEFRARLVPEGIAVRVTLNSMIAEDAAGVALGLDTDRDASTGTDDWGAGIGRVGKLGLEHVLVTWGSGAMLDGAPVPSTADTRRNQIDVTIPLQPGGATWRAYLGVGLFDAAAKTFKTVLDNPTAASPGGAHGKNPPPFFNVGFRLASQEPMTNDPAATIGTRTVGAGAWRDHAQALALAARDISAFHADVDFAKLGAAVTESHVPASGYLNRLYSSHIDLGEGARTERPMLRGSVQPYAVYVPATYVPGVPSPLTLDVHSLSSAYNQYMQFSPNSIQQLGEQRGSFILSPEGRGPDGWWHDEAELDVFEAWADLASHYTLDPDHVAITGYSMGGYGTYKLASQYPDLFGKGFAIVGPADESILGGPTAGEIEDSQNTLHIVRNLWNVPLLMWNGTNDELVPVAGVLRFEEELSRLGLRHELDLFPGYDHFLFAELDEWGPGKTWLGTADVNRNPSHVKYTAMPEMDNAALGLVHDHAYWVSDVRVRPGSRSGIVDARSLLKAEYHTTAPYVGTGVAPNPHARRGTEWLPLAGPSNNYLKVVLEDVSSVTLWLERCLDLSREFTVEIFSSSDVVVSLRTGATQYSVHVGPGGTTVATFPPVTAA